MPRLGGGGAERVVATIIRYLDKKQFKVHLILFKGDGEYQELIPQEVSIEILNTRNIVDTSLELIKSIRRINPKIVFSSMRSVSALLGILSFFFPRNTRLIFRENNTPSVSIAESRFPLVWKIIYKTIFRRANTIICQSDYMVDDFKEKFNFTGNNLMKIYNPVDFDMIDKKSDDGTVPFQNNGYKNVVAIGKMSPQKGFDLLLHSFALNRSKTKDVNLWLLGDGEYINSYKELAETLDITDQVYFVGRQSNPYVWLKHADLFILPSRYEGLPNVLLEALSCHCPVIVTNHPGGTNEIMNIIGSPNRIVNSLNWEKKWFNKMVFSDNEFKNNFDVMIIMEKYVELFNSDT